MSFYCSDWANNSKNGNAHNVTNALWFGGRGGLRHAAPTADYPSLDKSASRNMRITTFPVSDNAVYQALAAETEPLAEQDGT